ncbi:unnamed protein product [Boreogadus saida]
MCVPQRRSPENEAKTVPQRRSPENEAKTVALLGPPQLPHQSLAVWSLEQLALGQLALNHLALNHLPLAKWPLDCSVSPVISFSSLLKSTSISPSISVIITSGMFDIILKFGRHLCLDMASIRRQESGADKRKKKRH